MHRINQANQNSWNASEVINRTSTLTFTFNGKSITAHPGDTIASALAANGVQVISRSFKYHRPRGLLCCAGHCPNCLVQIGPEMNVRACMTPAEEGLQVETQNAWPSLENDIMSLTQLGDELLPVGFYYKTFIRPKALWPVYEKVLRNAAGLGKLDVDAPPEDYDKEYLHGDVAVVGGGPAGMAAAVAAAEQGARVLLFDENPVLGGHQRFVRERGAEIENLRSKIENLENIQVFTGTTVLGWWEENWMPAVQGNRLFKIRAGAVVFATGAYEQPLVFENNDLPGIMLGSAVQRLINLYGVLPGKRAVVITANEDGWNVAQDLRAAGAAVTVVDERETDRTPFARYTVQAARGKKVVREAVIMPVNGGETKTLPCDLLVISVGWTPANGLLVQAGGQVKYDEARHEFLPVSLPEGIFAAGRVNGTHDLAAQVTEGTRAGLGAASFAGYGDTAEAGENAREAGRMNEPVRTSARVITPGEGKQFICFCEDVTQKDLKTAIAEGYNSVELLKRYSTISMGPCQGKMCSANTVHLCARENGWTVAETGTTTARPPMTPVKLGALAGQNMEPVRYSPVHEWHGHAERGARKAKMLVAGLWLRPEHYGDPVAEVKAVRERVGVIDVSSLGKLKMTGPGVPNLLDKLYVNKWQNLGVGRVRYGVMCNDEGVVTDDGVTGRLGEFEWLTTTTSSGASGVYEYIQWWVQSGWGDGVHVTNVTEDFAAFNLAGPRSRDVLAKVAGVSTDGDVSNEAFPYMHVRQMEVAGVMCNVFRIGFTGELSYEIHVPAGYGLHVWETLMDAGAEFGILPFGLEAQRVLRLEKGHIIVGQDTDALTDPISADMAGLVKHDKPNFLGNRPLARIAKNGPKQKLVGFKMVQAGVVPEEGLQIVRPKDGQNANTHYQNLEIIGWVTSCRFSPTLNEVIGLCWLPAKVAEEEGATFTIRREGQLVEARVHHGAFYDVEGTRLRM